MHGLSSDTEGVTYLLPRPALFAGGGDLVCLDPLSQPTQGQRSTESHCRIIRRKIWVEIFDVHSCQFRLTPTPYQLKTPTPYQLKLTADLYPSLPHSAGSQASTERRSTRRGAKSAEPALGAWGN